MNDHEKIYTDDCGYVNILTIIIYVNYSTGT